MSKASLELGGTNWAAKEGNLLGYAQGNESDRYVPREFSFTRAADIAATRINSSGLIEKYRENLLFQSNQFDTTWTTDGASVTSGESGYDGSSDAWKLSGAGGSFPRVQQNKSISGVSTFSVYAKSGNVNVLRLLTISGSSTDVKFQLTGSGSVLTQTGSERIESKITRLGSTDWYRCSITFNGSPTNFRIYPMSDSSTFAVNGEFVYIQDAQLERGLAATSYLESGATTAKAGVLENLPRIDYTGGTASLLLEPQRTNLIPNSEGADKTSSSSTSYTFNEIETPEGYRNSIKTEALTAGNYRAISWSISLSASTYTFSCYLKAGTSSHIGLYHIGTGLGWIDTSDFTKSSGALNFSIENFGNGWYRVYYTVTATVGNNSFYIFNTNGNGQTTSNVGDNFYGYGFQLEEGSYPTSYIPTYGTSNTREVDSFQNNTNDKPLGAIGQGTWFVELQKLGDDTNQALYLAPTSSNTQQIRLHFDVNNARFRDARNGYATIGGVVNVKTSMTKMALSIDTISGIAKVYVNGSQLGSDYTLQANTFEFSRIVAEGKGFILKQSLFFPEALSDANLATLTS